MASTVVRDVVERHNAPSSASPQQPFPNHAGGSSRTGFPAVQHRLKVTSAFKRARLDQRVQKNLSVSREGLSESTSRGDGMKGAKVEDSMVDISRSNAEAVERMTHEERERERQDVLDQLGRGVADLMIRVREARARRADNQATDEECDVAPHNISFMAANDSPPPSPPLRSTRRIRFVDPTEADIHVYESHPSSPKRTLALLPPPSRDQEKSGISSLGAFKGSMLQQNTSALPSLQSSIQAADPPEEGTPEDIRRRFFPSEMPPEDNPALTWMLPSLAPDFKSFSPADADNPEATRLTDTLSTEARYSLSGVRLCPSQISSLPTHLGLHHHASSSSDTPAGYTLSDLLLLSRSSVPAQRASILGVLAKILRVSREEVRGGGNKANSKAWSSEQVVDMEAMRKDLLDAAMDALGEKGGVGQRAVDLLWEVVVGFAYTHFDITDLAELPCVDLTPVSSPRSSSASQLSMPKEQISTKFSRHSILVALPLSKILPALKFHLVASPSPLSLTHSQVLDVLLVLSHFSQHARTIVSSDAGVIAAMLGPHLQSSSNSESEDRQSRATPSSIRILQVLTRCGRDVAATLTGPADVLLQYVMAPLPQLDVAQYQSNEFPPSVRLLSETLVFYTLLAQYGIYANVATIAQNGFAQVGTWLLTTFRVVAAPTIASLARAYLKLLEALIVCSTDPHKTTPSHDILWSQVRGWGWIEWTLDFTDVVAAASDSVAPLSSAGREVWEKHEGPPLWTSIFHTLASWVESASVNGIKRGEVERTMVSTRLRPLFESGRIAELTVLAAITQLQVWRFPSMSNVPSLETLQNLASAAGLVAAVTRLGLACLQPEEGCSFQFPRQEIHNVCRRFLENEATQKLFNLACGYQDTVDMPEDAHTFARPVSSLFILELQLWHRWITLSPNHVMMDVSTLHKEWVTQALRVLHTLLPGDEHYAKWIFESLCDSIDSNFEKEVLLSANLPDEQWNNDGMRILLPFLTGSLRPKVVTGENDHLWREAAYIAPNSPTPDSIASCTTLSINSLSYVRDAWMLYHQDLVLPVRSEWPTWPLNHLLHSGSSPVFRELPPNWDATETDVVRAALLLTRIVQELCGGHTSHVVASLNMSRAETIFACMKVFMLEHEQQQLDSGAEVFRDQLVTGWMNELLAPFAHANTLGNYYPVTECSSPLEHVSKGFLSTPFFQFYTDFLTLYDAISFSHPLFGRLLLPPISMTYAIDYRKLLFGDFGHIISTIKTGVGDLLCEDVREYLWPVEKDAQMLGWYLKALLKSLASDFIRWMAVHHLALNIWPDFRDGYAGNSEGASKLLRAIVMQGSYDVIRDIALYRQLKDEVWVPPKCYKQMDGDWVEQRLDFVERMGDQRVKEQLHRLFTD